MWKTCFGFRMTVCILLSSVSVSANTCRSIDGRFTNVSLSPDTFTPRLYRAVAEAKKGENFFLSPFSIATVLSMVYLGAKGNTAKELEDNLGIRFPKEKIHSDNKEYLKLLQSGSKNFILKSANRIYANKKLSINDGYKYQLTQFYLTTIESVDFDQDATQTREAINQWVSQYTNGKIKNIIPVNALKPETLLMLINAIYFKGSWKEKFDEKSTKERDFFLNSDQKVKRETMNNYKRFFSKTDRDFDCKILELPYVGKCLSMFVVLPNKVDGLASLEQKLNSEFFQNLVQRKGFSYYKIDVYLPKFHLVSGFELKDILAEMGLTDLFDGKKSDLSGIVGENTKAYVNRVVHKAFVEVNEKGTEASAATAVVALLGSSPGVQIIPEFRADHPFLFCIVDHRIKKVLFIGRVKDPQQKR